MKTKITPFDIVEHIQTPERQAGYLAAALEEGDPGTIALVLGDIVRAIGATKIMNETGLSRETIYKSFKAGGNPTLASVIKVSSALGLQLTLKPVKAARVIKSKPRIKNVKVTKRKTKVLQAAE